MSEWYDKRYFDSIGWLIEHYEKLDCTSDEGMLLIMLVYYQKYQLQIDYQLLQQKMKKSVDEIDALLHQLQTKGYLKIEMGSKGVVFDTRGIFEVKQPLQFEQDLFSTFETEFKRPLTRNELVKLSDWLQQYENQLIVYALREASIRSKYSFDYIDRILVDWKHKGFSAEDIENGKQYESK